MMHYVLQLIMQQCQSYLIIYEECTVVTGYSDDRDLRGEELKDHVGTSVYKHETIKNEIY